MSTELKYPMKGTDTFLYSVTFHETTPESLEDGDFSDSGFEVEEQEAELVDILNDGYSKYYTHSPSASAWWESTEPVTDRNHYENGVNRYYNLHVKHTDGTPLTQEEHDFITALMNDGKYRNDGEEWYAWGGQAKYGVGGFIIGTLLGGFVGFGLGKSVGYGRAVRGYEGGGEVVSDELYKDSVNHWIFFTLNFNYNWLDAFTEMRSHLESKFNGYYEKYGSYGAMTKFWSELSGNNRKALATWAKNNYTGSHTPNVSDEEYEKIVNHWVYFTLNYPNYWTDAFTSTMRTHLKSKFSGYYDEYGGYGVMTKFYIELDMENRLALTSWVKENYTGTPLMATGGGVDDKIKANIKANGYKTMVIDEIVKISGGKNRDKAIEMANEKGDTIEFTLSNESPLPPQLMARIIVNSYKSKSKHQNSTPSVNYMRYEIHSKVADSDDKFELDTNLPVRKRLDKKHAYEQVKQLNKDSNGRFKYKVVETNEKPHRQGEEYAGGGDVKVGDKVTLSEIKMPNGNIQFERVENGTVKAIDSHGIYDVHNHKTNRIHRVSKDQIESKVGSTYKGGGTINNYDWSSKPIELKISDWENKVNYPRHHKFNDKTYHLAYNFSSKAELNRFIKDSGTKDSITQPIKYIDGKGVGLPKYFLYVSESGSTYQGGGEIKDVSGNYYSTNDFVSVNKLEKEAEKLFGKDWEAEDDVWQIQQLIDSIGGKYKVDVANDSDEWEEWRYDNQGLANDNNDSNYDIFVIPTATYSDGGEVTLFIDYEEVYLLDKNNNSLTQIGFDNIGEAKEYAKRNNLNIVKTEREGGSTFKGGGEIIANPSYKYQSIVKRWLDDNPSDGLKYKLAVALLKGEKDPDEKLGIKEGQYERLLRSLEKLGGESPHEMAWRTNNYSTHEAEGWTKEALAKFFALKGGSTTYQGGGGVEKTVWKNSQKTWAITKKGKDFYADNGEQVWYASYDGEEVSVDEPRDTKVNLPKSVMNKLKSLYKSSKSKYDGGGGVDDDFVVHGHYTVSNSGGYEIMLSDDGDGARVRDAYGSDNPETSDWLEIEYVDVEDGELDDEGYPENEPVIDPNGYNIPLNMVMRSHDNGGGVGSWEDIAISELRANESDDTIVLERNESDHITAVSDSGAEYMIFQTEDDAEQHAINRVREDLENEPYLFTESWLVGHIDTDEAKDFFEGVYGEWDLGYAEDIRNELDDTYVNRLVSEMVDNGIMSEDEANSDEADSLAEERIDTFAQALTNDKIEEGDGGYEHYKSNFGDEEARKILIQNNLIDLDVASADAVTTDGVPHFLSGYDGEEITLGKEDYKAYRTN